MLYTQPPHLHSTSIHVAGDGKRSAECTLPFVSVVVPCRNEERYIARCLDSLLANDYPKERLEILILDGRSEDRTRSIVNQYVMLHHCVRLVDNPARSIPAAMNTGNREARGDIIIKMDAHSIFSPVHISSCVRYLIEWGAENVGGILHIQPGADTRLARAIVLALSSRFGSGNALIKTGVDKPTWSDAVAFGCYRKEFLQEIGGFDERLFGSSDMDLNRRIRAAGGKILLVPEVVVEYFADADWRAFRRHNFADGVWTAYVLKFHSKAFSTRHWIPFVFLATLLLSLLLSVAWPVFLYFFAVLLGTYLAVDLAVSAQIGLRERDGKLFCILPAVFAVRHFGHGIGALFGCVLLLFPGVHWKGRRSAKG